MHDPNEIIELTLDGSPDDRPWEGCVNSVNYRVPRGVPVALPAFVAEHVERTEAERRSLEHTAAEYCSELMRGLI